MRDVDGTLEVCGLLRPSPGARRIGAIAEAHHLVEIDYPALITPSLWHHVDDGVGDDRRGGFDTDLLGTPGIAQDPPDPAQRVGLAVRATWASSVWCAPMQDCGSVRNILISRGES